MKLATLTLAMLGVLTNALPTTPNILEPVEIRSPPKTLPVQPKPAPIEIRDIKIRGDGRAATIFKSSNLHGESTFVPANNYCTNINVVPGGFDGEIRSLSVERGFKCSWYQ